MDNTKKLLRELKADAMLTGAADLRAWLTGFRSSFGFVYTDAQESVFFTDPRYAEGAKEALRNSYTGVAIAKNEDSVFDFIKSKKIKKLAVPVERLTQPEYERLRRRFKLVDSTPAFVKAMSVKNEEELANISRACEIAEEAYLQLLSFLKEGVTENETAGYLEYLMRKCGAEDRSFETIAAFGKNSSVPHHASDGTKLKSGTPILLDFGCKVNGYCSDITRTLWFGGKPDDEFKSVYESVLTSHLLARDNIRAGMKGREADAIARDYLAKQGLDKFFTHSLGHGIGINIHEFPTLSPKGEAALQDGMVFSIEPGVYFEGKFGIRIEDSVTLKDGRVVSFMKTDKNLTLL